MTDSQVRIPIGEPNRDTAFIAQVTVPKVIEATLTVRSSNGAVTIVTWVPEEDGSLEVVTEELPPVPADVDIRDTPSSRLAPIVARPEKLSGHRIRVGGAGQCTLESLVRAW